MEKVRLRARAKRYHFVKLMYMNGVNVGRLTWLICTKFPEVAKAMWDADGKCVEIEISIKVVK